MKGELLFPGGGARFDKAIALTSDLGHCVYSNENMSLFRQGSLGGV